MKKSICIISIFLLFILAGCSTDQSDKTSPAEQNSIESTVSTTLEAAQDAKNDPTETQKSKDVKKINKDIKISLFSEELSTNKLADGEEYDVKHSSTVLPSGVAPIGFPDDILSSHLSYKQLDDNQYWFNFRYANTEKARYIFFQATDANNFENVDDKFITSLPSSNINGQTVYITSYPNVQTKSTCFLAYYGQQGYRCMLESVNLEQEEFLKILSSSIK